MLYIYKRYPSIIVRSCQKNATIQNAFFAIKTLKSSGYNKDSGFKRLSDTVLIQKVSIYYSDNMSIISGKQGKKDNNGGIWNIKNNTFSILGNRGISLI